MNNMLFLYIYDAIWCTVWYNGEENNKWNSVSSNISIVNKV